MEISRQVELETEIAHRLDARLMVLVFEYRCQQVREARALREIERTRHYLRRGCRTMAEYGEKIGYDGEEAEMLTAVGRALELRPAFREEILTRQVMLEDVAAWIRGAGVDSKGENGEGAAIGRSVASKLPGIDGHRASGSFSSVLPATKTGANSVEPRTRTRNPWSVRETRVKGW